MIRLLKRIFRFAKQKYDEMVIQKNDLVTTRMVKKLPRQPKPRIFYFGVPRHSNMGDLAQYYCIKGLLQKQFSDYDVVEVPTLAYIHKKSGCQKALHRIVDKNDLMLFQSGYCTQDLGGNEDEMHQAVMTEFPHNDAIAMPQTVFFQAEERRKRAEAIYNQHGKRLLYFARDQVSYEIAKEMFYQNDIRLMPDIVTSLIGSRECNQDRKGILLCCRNDGEQYYSKPQIIELMEELKSLDTVELMDTTLSQPYQEILADLDGFIQQMIGCFEKARVVITDRFHGNIFSLIANTPVIILRTTDHKVTEGAKWFTEPYPKQVYTVNRLEDVKPLIEQIFSSYQYETLEPYFERNYFCSLRETVDQWRTCHSSDNSNIRRR